VRGLLDAAAVRHGVPADLVRAIAWQESGWSQSARSGVGALGVMQLMPATARWVGRDLLGRPVDRTRVEDNVEAGVAYLAWLRRHMGSTRLAVAAYYQGQGSVRADGLLGETERYVASVASLRGRV
jgi:soluble lytic murein transglycosylase-like protein